MSVDAPEDSDARLWQRARAGDEHAFGDLFARHAQRVYQYCFRRLASWALAEDAVQHVFIELWRKLDVVLVEDSLLPYLLAVANNVVRNASRGARRHASFVARLPVMEAVPDHAESLAERVDDERRMQHVLGALGKLRRHDQDVIAMCDWEGLSYAEAAAALGVPVGTVRSRLSRARQKLRDELTAAGVLPQPAKDELHQQRGELS